MITYSTQFVHPLTGRTLGEIRKQPNGRYAIETFKWQPSRTGNWSLIASIKDCTMPECRRAITAWLKYPSGY